MKQLCIAILLLCAAVFAKNGLTLHVCQHEDYNCYVYQFEDVKTYRWINDNQFIRITFLNGTDLDLHLDGYTVEVKKW